ncbi:MAG: tripartite tricarboxylate transporter permease, partial [Spirochaetia bacterium]|nr:tripartite tricarboxylate transporter permease [Spirochaetia bacterium]
FSQSPQIVNNLFMGFLAAQFLMLVLGYFSIRAANLIFKVPLGILYPTILCLCLLGAYSLGNSAYDVLLAMIFGVVGYFMKKYGFSSPAVILGLILGPIAEQELGRALIISYGDWTVLFKSPLSIMFYVFAIFSVAYSLGLFKKKKRT